MGLIKSESIYDTLLEFTFGNKVWWYRSESIVMEIHQL